MVRTNKNVSRKKKNKISKISKKSIKYIKKCKTKKKQIYSGGSKKVSFRTNISNTKTFVKTCEEYYKDHNKNNENNNKTPVVGDIVNYENKKYEVIEINVNRPLFISENIKCCIKIQDVNNESNKIIVDPNLCVLIKDANTPTQLPLQVILPTKSAIKKTTLSATPLSAAITKPLPAPKLPAAKLQPLVKKPNFFEPQESAGCGRHALNNLLQNIFFIKGEINEPPYNENEAKEKGINLSSEPGYQFNLRRFSKYLAGIHIFNTNPDAFC